MKSYHITPEQASENIKKGNNVATLHPLAAISKAHEARSFLAAFAGHDFGEFAEASHHDRRHLATALDHIEELAAMVLALAEREVKE